MSETNTTTNTESKTLQRANILTVSIDGSEFVAHFYRTHKHIADLAQHSTTFVPKSENKNTQREEFRMYAASIAHELDISYQPEDQRTAENMRRASYPTDQDLQQDAVAMVYPDVQDMLHQSGYDKLFVADVSCDSISPIYRTPRGSLLSDIGIREGKYERSQKWAWAKLDLCATIGVGDADAEGKYPNYVWISFQMDLVSGQLKKPQSLDGKGWTKTAWRETLTKELDAAGLLPKKEEAQTQETPPAPPTEIPPQEGSKGKGKKHKESQQAVQQEAQVQ